VAIRQRYPTSWQGHLPNQEHAQAVVAEHADMSSRPSMNCKIAGVRMVSWMADALTAAPVGDDEACEMPIDDS
jgi:hypothetical protein